MLQARVNELKSGILDIEDGKVLVTGFIREEMLLRHLENGTQCFSSKGIYKNQNLVFHNIQNEALIIVRRDGKEIRRHQFKPIHKESIQYKEWKDEEEKLFSVTYTIRKSIYSDHYHFLTETSSLLFENKVELDKYLLEKYKIGGIKFDFIAIDFEIASKELSSACSMGLVFVANNEIVDKKHIYIQPPGLEFDPEMVDVHGITLDDVKDAKKFDEIWREIKDIFTDSNIFVAHNAQFDMSVLHACLTEYNLELPDFTYIDSIAISTRACSGVTVGNSLKERTEFFGISLENHHDALADAFATAELVLHCVNLKKKKSLESYCRLHRSIAIKSFSELKPIKSFVKRRKFTKVSVSEIAANAETFDENHILFGKNIVFTGELETIERKTAMQKVADLGGVLKSGVSSKTHYLVVGKQDKSLVGEDGLSTKEEKAYELVEKGKEIKIITEHDFLKMID
ncbi:exonuclease domain-containing protein [Fredinandcohnia onubensis]|uniref:exonuclease domain-containing protein n=1 Tax=Fredinandcohnia onubensis TaxID=1571209 RepID=UPI00211E1206|nr:exonuclease domain-containing protein [Fredinandcohnia onubensis]